MLEKRDILAYLAIKNKGNYERIKEDLKEKVVIKRDEFESVMNQCPFDYVTILDDDYPVKLKGTIYCPLVLFYSGNKKLLDSKLPVRYGTLETNRRFLSTVCPVADENDRVVFDYITMAESAEDLNTLLKRIMNMGIIFKKY